MQIIRNKNTITINLTDDESTTMDYVDATSSIFFSNFLQNFINGRKAQHEEELKRGLLQDIPRDQLIKAQQMGIDKIITILEAADTTEVVK